MSKQTENLSGLTLENLFSTQIQDRMPFTIRGKRDVTIRITGISVDPALPNNPGNTCYDWLITGVVLDGTSQPPAFTGKYNTEKRSGEIEWRDASEDVTARPGYAERQQSGDPPSTAYAM